MEVPPQDHPPVQTDRRGDTSWDGVEERLEGVLPPDVAVPELVSRVVCREEESDVKCVEEVRVR